MVCGLSPRTSRAIERQPQLSRMRNLTESAKALRELLPQRILVLDGAMGTMLQQRNPSAEDFGGAALEGCNENLVRTRPDVVLDIHRKYFEAGADIVETNSFGSAPIVLAEYGLAADALLLSRRAAELARQAADEFSTSGKPRFVAGSMGPTTKAITVTGGVTFEELRDAYHVQAKGLVEGGVDLLLVETCQDTRNIKAALLAIQALSREIGAQVPFIVSVTIEAMGSMLAGQTVEAMWASLRFAKPLANCKDLHRPMRAGDDLDDAFAWKEERTLSRALTLQYDKVLFILEPGDQAKAAIGKRVTVVDYPDGRLSIRYNGVDLAYRTFDKIQQVDQGAIADNKRLGAVLAMIRDQQLSREPQQRSQRAPRRRDQRDARLFKVG